MYQEATHCESQARVRSSSGVTRWGDTPNEEARVPGHLKSHLKWPNTLQGSEWHFQGCLAVSG